MPAERRAIPVEVLRRAVRERVAETSIRSVAGQTGMSATGLWRFLRGTEPYEKTQRRLQRWYVVQQAAAPRPDGDAVDEGVARAAIALLTRHIPPRRRAAHVRRLLDALADPGGREPGWIETLRAEADR